MLCYHLSLLHGQLYDIMKKENLPSHGWFQVSQCMLTTIKIAHLLLLVDDVYNIGLPLFVNLTNFVSPYIFWNMSKVLCPHRI